MLAHRAFIQANHVSCILLDSRGLTRVPLAYNPVFSLPGLKSP
jgi:hypothetical protein